MLKKRLVGVVTVKDSMAVQSIGYKKYLPLGNPLFLVQNLDNWGADEIYIQCIDRSSKNLGPDLELLKRISNLGISTPLIYGGGIRNTNDAIKVIKMGADRIGLDFLLQQNQKEVCSISKTIGAQAIIGVLPINIINKNIYLLNHVTKIQNKISNSILKLFSEKIILEIMIVDWKNEGKSKAFNKKLLDFKILKEFNKILFGGITDINQIKNLMNKKNINAICTGNSLNYTENSISIISSNISTRQVSL